MALFFGLVAAHARALGLRRSAERAALFYERGLARLDGRWQGFGETGARFLDETHPYAADLDLFGPGSLFQHLCTARSRPGEETLARWLLTPAEPELARARQAAVVELRERLDLREDLFVLGSEVGSAADGTPLVRWGEAPPLPFPRLARPAAAALAALNLCAAALWFNGLLPWSAFLPSLLPAAGFAFRLSPRVRRVIGGVDRPARELQVFARLLQRLEREPFECELLVALRRSLDTGGLPPSRQIERLSRLVARLESRRNQLFAPLAALLLWTTQVALAIEAWRLACGPRLGRWTSALGELEALASLAGYAFEQPDDAWPEIDGGAALFAADGLAHPLIPAARAVRNDLRLDGERRLLLLSGSNMSGKSTLLRAAGTNLVLAWCGAPVRARRLRVSRLALGASLRVHDSLQAGASRFYAEITRLRQVLDLARAQPPLLFLLDEILHGTNSSDRLAGSEAVVRALLQRGGLGLVTTHDLALAAIAEALGPQAANVHFEDQLVDGRMSFDYRLRPGVVRRGNALELMRAVGLPV